MGNWNNRRRFSRKKYDYVDPPPSPPTHTNCFELDPPGVDETSVPQWERNFCISVGIPWQRVVNTKKYMHCSDNILKWNDSVCEEAFHDAKRRFWAKINGLPCDPVLPDPDLYIDVIDWHPKIDPQLILDLDQEYFNPSGLETGCVVWSDIKITSTSGNPWKEGFQGNAAVKEGVQGWDQWESSLNLGKIDDPWEKSYMRSGEGLKNSAWGDSGDRSWDWNAKQKEDLNGSHDNFWNYGNRNVGFAKDNGWTDVGDNSWNQWGTTNYMLNNSYKGRNLWTNDSSEVPIDRGWADYGHSFRGWKQRENSNNDLHFQRPTRGGRPWNGGCRKREGRHQHTIRYKSSRFQGDDIGIGNQWRNGRT